MEKTKGQISPKVKQQESAAGDESVVRNLEGEQDVEAKEVMKSNTRIIFGVYILVIVLGVGTGYLLSAKNSGRSLSFGAKPTVINTDTVVGSTDTTTFKDSAEGVIEVGGLDGEGSHKLIREGGPSQTAYLVSSVVDLDEFAGKKVRVWGQTMAAKKVPWLMDVGKVERLE